MTLFIYSAAQRSGEIVKGEREAENEKKLAELLKQEGLLLLNVQEKGAAKSFFGAELSTQKLFSLVRRISLVDKMFFTRNLAVMIGAGLPFTKALQALAEESSNPKFRKIIRDLNASILKGVSFADSCRSHQKIFGDLFIGMIEVGEASGKLTLVLKLLAHQMKRDSDLRRRLQSAMMYPMIIVIALLGIGTFMMVYVVPTLSKTIKELGAPLPFSTQLIMGLSDLLVHYGLWVAGAVGGMIILFWRILKTARGKEVFDHMVLQFPVFGPLVKKFNVARFCRILAYLVTAGIPIVRALEITISVLGNTLFREATRAAARDIEKGIQLHVVLGAYPKLFPPLVIQMISVGEETGTTSNMLLRLALFFEEEVNTITKNFSTIIEPILMIFIGVVVGFFAISMLQPIYSSLGNIGG